MKKRIYAVFLILFLTSGLSLLPAPKIIAQQVSVSFQAFYDGLSPYGTWVNYPAYGYVWIPTAVPHGFRPYATGGHWVYTPDGWLWVSDYDWGWATFHYGNWFYDDSYGWIWSPGYDWAPAWVTWGEYQGNYCWAPIAPRISVSVISYRPPHYYWNFVPRERITNTNVNNYVRVNNTTVVNNITVINNVNRGDGGRRVTFMRGPQPQTVERYTHTVVRPVQVRETSRPGRPQVQNGQLAIYRPAVNRNDAKPAPAHVQDMHNIKRDALPAVNRQAQPNTAPAKPNVQPAEGRTKPNANPGNNPAFNNKKPNEPASNPGRPATNPPANNKPVSPRPSPNTEPRENRPSTNDRPPVNKPVNPPHNNPVDKPANPSHNNKPVMNSSPANNNRPPAAAPANKPINTPAPRANHPAPNPANNRPNMPDQRPVQHQQQPRPKPAPATHPQPANNQPAQPRENEKK